MVDGVRTSIAVKDQTSMEEMIYAIVLGFEKIVYECEW